MNRKQKQNVAAYYHLRGMAESEAFLQFAFLHGSDAAIPVYGMSMDEIKAEVARLYNLI